MNCGLFNTGSTGATVTKVPSVGSITDFMSEFPEDFKMADPGDLLKDNDWMPDSEFWSLGSELAASDNFLEVFADLTDSCDGGLLFDGSVTPDIPPVASSAGPFSTIAADALKNEPATPEPSSIIPEPQVAAPVDEKCATKKRTASDAFSEASNCDHDDYTTKFKKPAVVTETILAGPSVEKHTSRRVKNNIASKQSRHNRKQKYVEMEDQVVILVAENEKLRKKAEKMEELTKEMKKILIERMMQKK